MIALIEGTVAEKSEGEVIVMTAGGVGYRLMCSMNTLSALPAAGEKCRLYTHLNVREDAMELYGFLQAEERDMFRRLISISGIGARSALMILGSMPLSNLRLAILTGDVAALSRAPGIGKKIAQRIVLELRDKLSKEQLETGAGAPASVAAAAVQGGVNHTQEAVAALMALGYSQAEALHAREGVDAAQLEAEEIIRRCLKKLVKQ